MKGLFANSTVDRNQGRTNYGYLTESSERYNSFNELERLVENDEAYWVEVFEAADCFHIRLQSDTRRVTAETKGQLEKKGRGLINSLHQPSKEPSMPESYKNPHKAIEAYAEYALNHGRIKGLKMTDINYDNILENGNEMQLNR